MWAINKKHDYPISPSVEATSWWNGVDFGPKEKCKQYTCKEDAEEDLENAQHKTYLDIKVVELS